MKDFNKYKAGDVVLHKKYGRGIIEFVSERKPCQYAVRLDVGHWEMQGCTYDGHVHIEPGAGVWTHEKNIVKH